MPTAEPAPALIDDPDGPPCCACVAAVMVWFGLIVLAFRLPFLFRRVRASR